MGVLEPIAVERDEANVFLFPNGAVAAVDRSFVNWFAKRLDVSACRGLLAALMVWVCVAKRRSFVDCFAKRLGMCSGPGREGRGAPSLWPSQSFGLLDRADGRNLSHGCVPRCALHPTQA